MTSIIIPTYNEEAIITRTLDQLCEVWGDFEVIVVDGRSTDGTPRRVRNIMSGFPQPLRFISAERNRAAQLNSGADAARGDALLFLHADVLLPADAVEAIEAAFTKGSIVGGNFSLLFDGASPWNGFFSWVNRVRRSFGIYYGDSGVFVRHEVFRALGGFKPVPVMKDYEFIRRLERYGRTVCLAPVVRVSDRRWREQSVARTLLIWVWIQGLYSLGVPPGWLARWYRPVRGKKPK